MPSISLVEAEPRFGDTIHYTYEYDRTLKPDQNLIARANCHQGEVRVYREIAAAGRDDDFQLGPTPRWQGGAAEGLLELIVASNGRLRVVATSKFSVLP